VVGEDAAMVMGQILVIGGLGGFGPCSIIECHAVPVLSDDGIDLPLKTPLLPTRSFEAGTIFRSDSIFLDIGDGG
jgi:hypothetical protein